MTRITAERMFALFREEALTVVPGATAAAVETIRTALALLQVLTRGDRTPAGGGADDAVAGRFVGDGRGWGRPRRDGVPDLVTILRSRRGLGDKPLARLFAWAFDAVRGGDYRRLRSGVGGGAGERAIRGVRDGPPAARRCVLAAAGYLPLGAGGVALGRGGEGLQPEVEGGGKDDGPPRQRSIADKEFRRLCAMVRHRTLYDPNYSGRSGRAAGLTAR